MNSTFAKTSFILGEISPRVFGRFEENKPIYRDGAGILENFLIFQWGGAFFRPGTQYISNAGQVDPVRLDTFQFSLLQEYIIEFGNQYLQFYADSGQLQVSPGVPVNIVTPYLQADLFNLQLANKQDVMYIANPNYPIYKLIRTSATSFVIQKVQFIGGPFLDTNIGNVTITASSATGNTSLTATIPAWVTGTQYLPGDYVTNGGNTYLCLLTHVSTIFATDLSNGDWILRDFFQSGHVGSLWSLGATVLSGVVVITGYTSSTILVGYVQNKSDGTSGNLGTTSATKVWAEGSWSGVRGYPVTVAFHEGRLVFGGTTFQPQTAWGSVVNAYEDFSPGSATDSDAWNYTSSVGDAIQWMKSIIVNGATGLRMGTLGGCISWLDGTPSTGITPSAPPTIIAGADYQVQYMVPRAISSYLFYMQGNTYQLRQIAFDFSIGADKSEDMMLLADHILRDGNGCIQIARQESPNDRIWCIRNDGQMAIMTRNVEQQVIGWTRMIAGATAGGNGIFNSVAIIPIQGSDDQVWVAVSRVINGVQKQFIELFTPELFNQPWEPIRMDASLSINLPITITGISQSNPGVITAPTHGLSNGDQIRIDLVVGMNYQGVNTVNNTAVTLSINNFPYLVGNVTTNTFTITDIFGNSINTTLYTSYISGGEVRKMNTVFSGLDYLNGETVVVTADSGLPAAQQTFVVSGGSITLPNPAAVVHVGLPYTGTLQLLSLGEQSGGFISQTKKRKIYKITARVWNSSGGDFGDSLNNLYRQIYPTQTPNAIPGNSPDLFTGDVELDFESFFAENWSPYLIQDVPLPYMLLALVIRSDIQEGKSE